MFISQVLSQEKSLFVNQRAQCCEGARNEVERDMMLSMMLKKKEVICACGCFLFLARALIYIARSL
jgi:hypothetical protein